MDHRVIEGIDTSKFLSDLVRPQNGPSELVPERGRERRLARARQPADHDELDAPGEQVALALGEMLAGIVRQPAQTRDL